jgi:hypothetical protein
MINPDLLNRLAEINEAISRKQAALIVSLNRRSRIVAKRLRLELPILIDQRTKIEAEIAKASK